MTTRSLLVSRTSLALADLQLWSPGTYTVLGDSFGPGSQTLERMVAKSPYVKGRILLNAVEGMQDAVCQVEVASTSGSGLASNVAALLAAFRQSAYTMTAVWDDVPLAWTCEPADYSVGPQGVLEDLGLKFHAVVVSLIVPRSPVPVSGAF